MALTGDELAERFEHVIELLRRDGDLIVRETPPGAEPAVFDIRITAPGGAAGHDTSFRYYERYGGDSDAWTLDEYVYLMASQVGRGQLEYHLHRLRGSAVPVLHAHCRGAGSPMRGHFRSHQVLLEEARNEFLQLYAAGAAVDCQGLYPLAAAKA
jgi:hypothetical protein